MNKIISILILLSITSLYAQEIDYSKLTGKYLGQKTPKMVPEIFAPGIVSTGLEEGVITFMPDGKECYWSVIFPRFETILTSHFENER